MRSFQDWMLTRNETLRKAKFVYFSHFALRSSWALHDLFQHVVPRSLSPLWSSLLHFIWSDVTQALPIAHRITCRILLRYCEEMGKMLWMKYISQLRSINNHKQACGIFAWFTNWFWMTRMQLTECAKWIISRFHKWRSSLRDEKFNYFHIILGLNFIKTFWQITGEKINTF